MAPVPSGRYWIGSSPRERETAYRTAENTGTRTARSGRWFANEEPRRQVDVSGFVLDVVPVTQEQYAEFVAAGGAPPPSVSEEQWHKQGYVQNYDKHVRRFNWVNGDMPAERARHPVVLVTQAEAAAYCRWRGQQVGQPRRLPSARELEAAMRGAEDRLYPFGDHFDADALNSAVAGPFDTLPVASFPHAPGPFGHLDLAGNVFHWTSTPWRGDRRFTVKGSAWDDRGGVGRGAAHHGRQRSARHVIVGFRCAADR